ncbi:hypothetical protein BGY98DRAFT_989414 [Russula aff. rugulosa BPL654]|nr:hypothetical protein BGY98DRAFT_989414 [Russula aff. rugulosa BPL654]
MPTNAAKLASSQRPLADKPDDGITDFSDEEEKEIDSVEYLLALQQIRQEAHKASQANVKRQFAMVATEFRGHANAMVEEMTTYIDKLEIDALETTRDVKSIGAQAAAQAWNAQRGKMNEARVVDFSGMGRKEGVNRVSKLIEATSNKRRQAHYQLLRKVKTDLEGWRNHEKVVTDAKALVRRYKKLVKK